VLLLVTNLEKDFGLKIASQDVGREAFESVGSLIRFVALRMGAAGGDVSAAALASAAMDHLGKLPHGEPFRFVSRLTRIDPGISGEGVWSVKGDEAFFAGHFPGRPLVPGVLIAEALAQLSGIVGAAEGEGQEAKLAQVEVRFMQSAAPPAEIMLKSTLVRTLGALRQFEVIAALDKRTIAEGTLTIACEVER